MAQPTYTYKVTTPFAINGSKDEIPTTTEDGSVSLENGYGTLYETPPSEGGRFIRRGEWNYLINFLYNAIKELQDIITAGEFTVSASQTLTNILPIAKGGTGASTPEQARSNLGLGNVNNTSDANKPISTATQNALNGKLNVTGGTINGTLTVGGNMYVKGSTPALYLWSNSDNSQVALWRPTNNDYFVVQGAQGLTDSVFKISKAEASNATKTTIFTSEIQIAGAIVNSEYFVRSIGTALRDYGFDL